MTVVSLRSLAEHELAARFGGEGATHFVVVEGRPLDDDEGLLEGDVLALSLEADAEPGDLVVWWTGAEHSQALARVDDDLTLHPVAGFPPPPRRPEPSLRGVVVGRLRKLAPPTEP